MYSIYELLILLVQINWQKEEGSKENKSGICAMCSWNTPGFNVLIS